MATMLAAILMFGASPRLNVAITYNPLEASQSQQSSPFHVTDPKFSDRSMGETTLEARSTSSEKLKADYESGRISIDQYLLYKAWSVFDPSRLPTEYALSSEESQVYRKSGTMMIREIKENWNNLSPETQDELDFVFKRPTDEEGGFDGKQHLLPKLYDTTHFVIHWTNGRDGGLPADAPDLWDSDFDRTPDYIEDFAEIFEYVWEFEVTNKGFHAPPSDWPLFEPNDAYDRNPDTRYDVFVYNMSVYGYAKAEAWPDSPSYSFIGVDNDYKGFPTPQLQAMQVTAAHEFHHATQFYYDCTEEKWWMETTAVYMEDEVYPDVNDNYQYLSYWFDMCDSLGLETFDSLHEYGNFIFAKRLSEDFGDDVIREIWEEMEETDGIDAIDNVLVRHGSNFVEEFSRFTIANFFLTKPVPLLDDPYGYVDGISYREVLTGTTAFDGVWLEYQYNATVEPDYIVIDSGNVNAHAWMDRWATDYITIDSLDPHALRGYRIFFDGLDPTTEYVVILVSVRQKYNVLGSVEYYKEVITFQLDDQKDGFVNLHPLIPFPREDWHVYSVLIIANAGNTTTAYPSWRVMITSDLWLDRFPIEWPMFRNNLRHEGYSTSPAPITNQTIWNYTTGGTVSSSPAVAHGMVYGRVYFGSWDYNVYCLNALTGAHIWNYTTGNWVISSPAVAYGRVYFGSYDGKVYCLDASTGAHIWNYTTGDSVRSSPAVAYGMVYFGSYDGKVYCLDASTGAKIWSYRTGDAVETSPAVAYGRVYFGSNDKKVYCLNALTGAYIWSYTTSRWLDSSPAVAYGMVYFGSMEFNGNVYCLNAFTGAYIWSYTTGDCVRSSPAVAYGMVYVGSLNGKIYCLDALTGAYIWSYTTTQYWVGSSPAVAYGMVYVGSHDNNVYCLNASTGARIWSYNTGSWVDSSPAVADGMVFVGSKDGRVYAFGARSILGDLNGDGVVNMLDITLVAQAYGAEYNETDGMYWHDPPCKYCPHTSGADLDGNKEINILDIYLVAKEYG